MTPEQTKQLIRREAAAGRPVAVYAPLAARVLGEAEGAAFLASLPAASVPTPAALPAPPPPCAGACPGTELKRLLAQLGFAAAPGCACEQRAAEMDRNGLDWCLARRDEIAAWLAEGAGERVKELTKGRGWLVGLTASVKLLTQPWVRLGDVIGSIVDEAIRRAAAKAVQ